MSSQPIFYLENDNAPGQGGEVSKTGDAQQNGFCFDSRSSVKVEVYIANPREHRLLTALLERGSTSRHDLDSIVGAENTPDLVFRLRQSGWDLPCERRNLIDRDGETVRVGIYSLSAVDRTKVMTALRRAA